MTSQPSNNADQVLAVTADHSLREHFVRMAKVVRRVIGVPDYERYLTHQRQCHPGEPVLTRDAFARDALARRYSQAGNRCC